MLRVYFPGFRFAEAGFPATPDLVFGEAGPAFPDAVPLGLVETGLAFAVGPGFSPAFETSLSPARRAALPSG